MGKVCTRFRPKRRKNPTLRGGTYLYSLYKAVLVPPPGPGWLNEGELPTQATLGEPTFPTFPY